MERSQHSTYTDSQRIHATGTESVVEPSSFASSSQLRILVIDDEQAMLDAIHLFFQDEHEIVGCDNADEARKLFSEQDFDVVIADLKLGRDNGAALLTEFKTLRPECVRILMTGYTDMAALIRAINEGGISYYLTKPIELLQLRMMINRVVEMIQLRSSNEDLMVRIQEHNLHLEKLVALRSSELQRANESLQRLQQSREQVIRMSVHDLQNPLNNLDSVLSELRSQLQTDDELSELLDIARSSSELMRALVEDMLSIAMLSKPDIQMRQDIIEVGTLLRSSARAFSSAAERKNIWINVQIDNDCREFVGDQIQLRKALDNLVSNAIKYTPAGGSVDLSTRCDEHYLSIEVRDTGLGMTPEDIDHAFREFSRLSAQPTAGENSTGLGLFIVKKIIELHGGDASASSEGPNKGTVITLTLPITHPSLA